MIDIERSMIEGRMVAAENGEGLVLEVSCPSGAKTTVTPPDGGFVNGTFTSREDDLIWKAVK